MDSVFNTVLRMCWVVVFGLKMLVGKLIAWNMVSSLIDKCLLTRLWDADSYANTWSSTVAMSFFKPFNLDSPSRMPTIHSSNGHPHEHTDEHLVWHSDIQPFPIFNAGVQVSNQNGHTYYLPLEMTPLYYGIAGRGETDDGDVGGSYMDPIAFCAEVTNEQKATIRTELSHNRSTTLTLSSEPSCKISVADQAGLSSSALAMTAMNFVDVMARNLGVSNASTQSIFEELRQPILPTWNHLPCVN